MWRRRGLRGGATAWISWRCKSRAGGLANCEIFQRSLHVLLRQRADLYHFQDPELLPVALLLKTIFRKRVVFDSYEDFAAMALTMRGMPRPLRPVVATFVGGVAEAGGGLL